VSFHTKVSAFRKEFFIENGMYETENNIFLYIVYKTITIVLISNKYYQFRTWYKFIGVKFIGKIHMCFTTKDMEM